MDCDAEFEEFVKTMDILGPKLGPMVFQFPSFDRWKFPRQDSFLAVLEPFLKKLPADHEFVIEIRIWGTYLWGALLAGFQHDKIPAEQEAENFAISMFPKMTECLQNCETCKK